MGIILRENDNADLAGGDEKSQSKPRAGLSDVLAGEAKSFVSNLQPYLPQDLIGGSVPQIAGFENEAVWNAACQACGTDKVHYVYSVSDGRVWYLACPSSAMASNPDSWCPMAAALPGNSEYWDRETVYLYEQEGTACALRWDGETGRMQLFLGASRSILPRIQSMDANFVTVNPDVADIVAWRSGSLKTERLSRAVVRMLIVSGLIVNLIAVVILFVNIVSISSVNRDLSAIKEETDKTALELVDSASNVMQSDAIKHMVRVQHILDNISLLNGYLVRYEVVGNRVEWSAIVPQGLASKAIEATTFMEILPGRVKRHAPKVSGPEDGDNVRIEGKR